MLISYFIFFIIVKRLSSDSLFNFLHSKRESKVGNIYYKKRRCCFYEHSRRDLTDYQAKSGTKLAYDYAEKKGMKIINTFNF